VTLPLELLDLSWASKRTLDRLRGTRMELGAVQHLATEQWPGCRMILPDGTVFDAPR